MNAASPIKPEPSSNNVPGSGDGAFLDEPGAGRARTRINIVIRGDPPIRVSNHGERRRTGVHHYNDAEHFGLPKVSALKCIKMVWNENSDIPNAKNPRQLKHQITMLKRFDSRTEYGTILRPEVIKDEYYKRHKICNLP